MFAVAVPAAAGRRRPLRLRPRGLRQPGRLLQRLAVLDHRLGRERGDRRRLGALRRGVRQQGRQNKLVLDRPRADRAVDPGRDQPHRRQEHGRRPAVDVDPEVHPAGRSCRRSGCSSSAPATSRPGTSAARATSPRSAGPWPCACSPTSASRPRRWRRRRSRDPDRNVPRATIFGTLGTAVVYLLSLIAVFGIVPQRATLGESTAPFSTAVNDIFGGTLGRLRDGRARRRSPASAR